MDNANPTDIRTLLVSDVHLGCKHSRASEFLCFLKQYRPETVYLVGDFIDAWKINSGWHWSDECDQIVEHMIGLGRQGTRIFLIPGNHDSFLRNPAFQAMLPGDLPHVQIADEFVFETLRGWKLLVTHGDLFDVFETRAQWISKLSTLFYDTCLSINRTICNAFFAETRNPYGGCAILKQRVKRGVRFVSGFESKIADHAKLRDCEGVVCGHIHTPNIINDSSMLYCNTGDWVENCTGLVEYVDGRIHLVSRYGKDQHLDLPARKPKGSMDVGTPTSESVTGSSPLASADEIVAV